MSHDLVTSETCPNTEAERRPGENSVLELRARFFNNANQSETSYAIFNNDYLKLQSNRCFQVATKSRE